MINKDLTVNSWDFNTWIAHVNEVNRLRDLLAEERDRRYREVTTEKDRASVMKEACAKEALQLARDIQNYKDEKANELREQISSERGLYVTKNELIGAVEKIEAMLKPLSDYVAQDKGRDRGTDRNWAGIQSIISIIVGLIVIGTFVFMTQRPPQQVFPAYAPAPSGVLLPANDPRGARN